MTDVNRRGGLAFGGRDRADRRRGPDRAGRSGRPPRRPRLGALALVGAGALAHPTGAAALDEPYLSIRTGLACSQCHVNRTGGGARNDFGSLYAQTRLPAKTLGFVDRNLSSFLAVGANLRVRASGAVSETTPRTEVGIVEESLQLEARVVPDVLAVYIDQILGPSSSFTREAFALVEGLPLHGYVKAGKFLLPYGIRLPDDQAFIRERTGFTYATPDQGIEVGIEPGPLTLFAAVTNGTAGGPEVDGDKQVTATAALVYPRFRVGASASRNDAASGRRDVVGAFGGFRAGRLAILGEFDYVFDEIDGAPTVGQFAAYLEGDVLVTRGLNFKATYGYLDPSRRIGENARVRLRFGVESFPIPFLQLSAFYTVLQDIPQATTDLDRIQLELHAFF